KKKVTKTVDQSSSVANTAQNPDVVNKPLLVNSKPEPNVDSVYMTADTLFSRMILAKEYVPLNLNLDRNGGQLIEEAEEDYEIGKRKSQKQLIKARPWQIPRKILM